MTWVEFATIVKELFVAAAAAATAVAAWVSLRSWRQELAGRAEFETAREISRCTLTLKDRLDQCRNPFFAYSEFPEDYLDTPNRQSAAETARAYQHIYANRWKPVRESLIEFESAALEAKVLWGHDASTLTGELRACVSMLLAAIQSYLEDLQTNGAEFNPATAENTRNRTVRLKGQLEDDDDFMSRYIELACEGVLELVAPHITKKKPRAR